jgi:hypothetical protein
MKIPVKECTLCGALISNTRESVERHLSWHRRVAVKPKRTTITNICDTCHMPMRTNDVVCRNTLCDARGKSPLGKPPVLEEPSHRPQVFGGTLPHRGA